MRKCLIPDFNDRSFIEDIWDDLRDIEVAPECYYSID
jgi:hypothetical protein